MKRALLAAVLVSNALSSMFIEFETEFFSLTSASQKNLYLMLQYWQLWKQMTITPSLNLLCLRPTKQE